MQFVRAVLVFTFAIAQPASRVDAQATPPDDAPTESRPEDSGAEIPSEPAEDPRALELSVDAVVTAPDRPPGDALGGSTHHVTEEELRTLDFADPDRVLARLPGVYVRSEDAYGLRPNIGMRGANSHRSRRVTLLEDGVPSAYAPYSSPSIFSLLPMSRVVGIDVYRGPSAILQGPQTIGGAIDFRTREIPEGHPAGSVDYTYGLNNYSRLHFFAGTSDEHLGAMIEGTWLRADGFQDIDGSNGNSGFDLADIAVRAFVRGSPTPGYHHTLSARFVLQLEQSRESYLGLTDADYAANPYRRYLASAPDEFSRIRTQGYVRYEGHLHDDLDITATAYRSDVARTWYRLDRFRSMGPSINTVVTDPSTPENAERLGLLTGARDSTGVDDALVYVNNDWHYVSEGVQVDARGRARHDIFSHDVRVGARLHYDSFQRNISNDGYLVEGGALTPDGVGRAAQNDDLAETLAFSAYAQYSLGLGPVTLAPGARLEWMSMGFLNRTASTSSRVDEFIVLPGGSVMVDPLPELRLFAGVHRGFTPPLPNDAPTVDPEVAINYELGGRYTDEVRRLRAEVTGFASDYDNITSQCTLTAGCTDIDRAFNAGRAIVWGFEMSASGAIPIDSSTLSLEGAYTFTDSTLLSAFSSADPQLGMVEVGDRLPYIPEHQASLGARLDYLDLFTLGASATLVGSMREEASQGAAGRRTDEQYLVDATGSVNLGHGVELFVRVENILLSTAVVSRRPWGARPTRPFQAQIGVRVDFE